VGTDNYEDLKPGVAPLVASNKLKLLSDYAKKYNKVAALTETGLQNVSQGDWYTNTLLKVLTAQKLEIAYALVWANRNDAYWTPHAAHPAAPDFVKFKNNGYVLFSDKQPKMYQIN
jgi:mannan endo-1,4-beta-mannosidase